MILLNRIQGHQQNFDSIFETWITSEVYNNEIFPLTEMSFFIRQENKTESLGGFLVSRKKSLKQPITDSYVSEKGASFIMYVYRMTSLFPLILCYNPPKISSHFINENILCNFVINMLKLALGEGKQLGIEDKKRNVLGVGDSNNPDIDEDILLLDSSIKYSLDVFKDLHLLKLVRTSAHIKGNILEIVATSTSKLLKVFVLDR